MADKKVLLVLVGALGDLAFRKFLKDAKKLEARRSELGILLVDQSWGASEVSLEQELHWRIGCRLIELRAEEITDGKAPGVNLTSSLGNTQLPWEIDEFVDQRLSGSPEALNDLRSKLKESLAGWRDYFLGNSPATGLRRYSSDSDFIEGAARKLKDEGWKIAVFVATPPQAYPTIVEQWRLLGADRIVLEKPAAGLNDKLKYDGANGLRTEASKIALPAQIATNDHYNAKLVTRAMDLIRDYRLFDHLLQPDRIKKIVVQLLEPAALPLGRYKFYNGAGGAFGDMVPHLLQAVRAILGLTTGQLNVSFEKFEWARDKDASSDPITTPPTAPYIHQPNYYQSLNAITETFVVFKATVSVGGQEIPLYCRTGKGLLSHKTLRLDVRYGESDAELSLFFDFGSSSIIIRDDSTGFHLATGKLTLKKNFQSGIPRVERYEGVEVVEYEGIFDCLVNSEWEPEPARLDTRYFPPVEDAANLADIVFNRLDDERQKRQKRAEAEGKEQTSLLRYGKGQSAASVLDLYDEEAHWK